MTRRAACLLLPLILVGCRRSPSAPPSVVLISIDTLRADHLSAYGYRGVETPALDSLRRDSMLFENAYCQVPLTLPSHATILTGLLPFQHGVRDNIGFRLSPEHATLASMLAPRGYACGAAVSSFALRHDRGLSAGFDFYDDSFGRGSLDERPGEQTEMRLERWIESVSGRPFFAFLHLYEPHAPYSPPEPFRSRYATSPYDGEIAAADAAVGRLLEFLKRRRLYDRAVVVFLSDHGEGLDDHGEAEHGVFLYREAIRVPFFFKMPGARTSPSTFPSPVGLVDVVPTVLAAAGVAAPPGLAGVNVFADSREPRASRRIYAETLYPRLALGWSDLASLVDARFQYIEAPRPELYDLVSDPVERADLSASRPAEFRRLRLALEKMPHVSSVSGRAAPQELEKLGSLGYISIARGSASGPLPDPKDKIATLKKFKRLFELFYARRDGETIAQAREIVSEEPAILSAWRMMANVEERRGNLPAAARALQKGLAAAPDASGEEISQTETQLAAVLERAGDRKSAEKIFRESLARGLATQEMKRNLARLLTDSGRAAEALALLPARAAGEDAATLDIRGVALAQTGRGEEARQVFLQGLREDPGNVSVCVHLGMLSLREKDPAHARAWFETALSVEPSAAEALTGLGLAQAALGLERDAYKSWTRALAADAAQYDALFNRAVAAGRMGRPREARHDLERFLAAAPRDRYAEKIAEARRLLASLGRN